MVNLLRQGPGVFFLSVALILLILVSVSAPVSRTFYFLKVEAPGTEIRFGNWGYVFRSPGREWESSGSKLGYDATGAIERFTDLGDIAGAIVRGLTFALIITPLAAFFALLAIVVSLSSNVILDIIGSLIAGFSFLLCGIAFVIQSVLFISARNRINDALPGSPASLSNAYWMVAVATILLLLASLTVCFGSAAARREKRSRRSSVGVRSNDMAMTPAQDANADGTTPPEVYQNHGRWWQRRRY